jgi:CRISPR/Cas system-associated exonuclease Cas4 (RecB family)
MIKKPIFSPSLCTIEDFVGRMSALRPADNLELVHRLHQVQRLITGIDEPFDQFYFWGNMLLKDFDEVDRNGVNAELLFQDLRNLKEIDTRFDFITDEQREFLINFWGSFEDPLTKHKRDFLQVWTKLFPIYSGFREELSSQGLAYPGMILRDVAERLMAGENLLPLEPSKPPSLIFVGFNALTGCEKNILSHFVSKGVATAWWDVDHYYLNDEEQEAGAYLRAYQQDPVLSKTFPADIPSYFHQPREVNVYGVAQLTGQAKLLSQLLREELQKGAQPEETLIVLPDERLLLPVLHGVAGLVPALNITMGFPLSSTPVFNLLETLVELQMGARDDQFNHRQVLAIFGHPYIITSDAATAHARRKQILKENWARIPGEWLRAGKEIYNKLFVQVEPERLISYLREVLDTIAHWKDISALDKEYALHFVMLLNRLEKVVVPGALSTAQEHRVWFRSFLRLFRQLVRQNKIPFSGEPLKGLQIMGVLETRSLDFKNVFILSLNEGAFPAARASGSYIPHSIRKAYNLSTFDQQDRMFAYLFYRVLQRAEQVHLFHNSETDVLGQGEMSRFLQQLIHESGWPIRRHLLHNPLQPKQTTSISIQKDQRVFDRLASYCTGAAYQKELSPTALRDYMECRLRFYFKYIAGIREADEVDEELDSRMLGNLLHTFIEFFYLDIVREKGSHRIEARDLDSLSQRFNGIMDRVLIKAFRLVPTKPVIYEGQRLIVREVVRRFANEIIKLDKQHAPFDLLVIEEKKFEWKTTLRAPGKPTVVVGGKIDRVDRKENLVRIIDYKTGKDSPVIKGSIEALFIRDEEFNKAAFQTILYALLYTKNNPNAGESVRPGLMNRSNLFDQEFSFGFKLDREPIADIRLHLPAFEAGVVEKLEEIFSDHVPFDQTTNLKNCEYCSFRKICYRD